MASGAGMYVTYIYIECGEFTDLLNRGNPFHACLHKVIKQKEHLSMVWLLRRLFDMGKER